jgi:hypothetical protein
MGATESGAVALVMERDTKAWSIGFDMRLFTAIYSVSWFDFHVTYCVCLLLDYISWIMVK